MKAFSRINIGEKISFIIGCKNYRILVVSKKTDKPCANCTRTCAICTSFYLALQALAVKIKKRSLQIKRSLQTKKDLKKSLVTKYPKSEINGLWE